MGRLDFAYDFLFDLIFWKGGRVVEEPLTPEKVGEPEALIVHAKELGANGFDERLSRVVEDLEKSGILLDRPHAHGLGHAVVKVDLEQGVETEFADKALSNLVGVDAHMVGRVDTRPVKNRGDPATHP